MKTGKIQQAMNNLIYLGEHDWSEVEYDWTWKTSLYKYNVTTKRAHVFYNISNNKYFGVTDFNYDIPVILSPNSNIYKGFINSFNASTEFKFGFKKIEMPPPSTRKYVNKYIIKNEKPENTFKLVNYKIYDPEILSKNNGYYIERIYKISEEGNSALSVIKCIKDQVIIHKFQLEEFLKLDFYEFIVEDNKGNQIKIPWK